MAGVSRRAKPAFEWIRFDLDVFNIRVERQDASTFFGTSQLPDPVIEPEEFLTVTEYEQASDSGTYGLQRSLEAAMDHSFDQDSRVAMFMYTLLNACGYNVGPEENNFKAVLQRMEIPMRICGADQPSEVDVCVLRYGKDVDTYMFLLLVQVDREYKRFEVDVEAQLIGHAIAALAENNRRRVNKLGLPPFESKVMAGITMKGTSPTFYKIPVTTDLVEAVASGTFPSNETVVYAHTPDIVLSERGIRRGMEPLDNRRIILSYFEAFKQFTD